MSSCVTFSPLPAASGSLQRERDRPFFTSSFQVCSGCLPGVGVDAQRFEVALADGRILHKLLSVIYHSVHDKPVNLSL